MYVFGGLVFVLFASAEVQPWAMPESDKHVRVESYKINAEKTPVNAGTKNITSYTNGAFSDVQKEIEPGTV